MNNVSWGTREIKAAPTQQQQQQEKKDDDDDDENKNRKRKVMMMRLLKSKLLLNGKKCDEKALKEALVDFLEKNEQDDHAEELSSNAAALNWIDTSVLKDSAKVALDAREQSFLVELIDKLLYPLDQQHRRANETTSREQQQQEELKESLNSLRNQCVFGFCMLNAFWIILMFTLQYLKERLKEKIYINIRLSNVELLSFEPTSFLFVSLFVLVLVVQYFTMLAHRSSQFMQIIRKTSLFTTANNKNNAKKRNFEIVSEVI